MPLLNQPKYTGPRPTQKLDLSQPEVDKKIAEWNKKIEQGGWAARGIPRTKDIALQRKLASNAVAYGNKSAGDKVKDTAIDLGLAVLPELGLGKTAIGLLKPALKTTAKAGKAAAKNIYRINPVAGHTPTTSKSQFKSGIDWAKFNKEIPANKSLMQEYNAIEETAKAKGVWMKNSDGSAFKGTPEQFVQQRSKNFKAAFPNPIRDDLGNIQINYHGQRAGKPFNVFKPSERGGHGVGNYTFAGDRSSALSYAANDEKKLYELYINSNSPQKSVESVFSSAFDDVTGRLQPGHDYLRVGKEQVTPARNFLKSAVGNNGMFDMTNPNIYKSVLPFVGMSGLLASTAKK